MSLAIVPPLDPHPGYRLVGRFSPGGSEWYEERTYRLGGSEIGSVIGVGFRSAYALHYGKLGVLDRDPMTPRMEWGTRLEPEVLRKFHDEHPELRFTEGVKGNSYVRNDRDWQLCTPDDEYIDPDGRMGMIEAKCADRDDAWGEPGPGHGRVPTTYRAQVLWSCDVLGIRQAWLCVLIGGNDYREYFFDLDQDPDADDDIAAMVPAGERFISNLRNGVHPEPGDGSESTYRAVRRLHPDIEPGSRGEVASGLAAEYILASIAEDEAGKEKRRVGSLVLLQAGTAQHLHAVSEDGEIDANRFAWRTWRNKSDGTPGDPYLMVDSKTKKAMTTVTIQEACK